MTNEMHALAAAPCELLALGEPVHPTRDASFAPVRNEVFADLAAQGFRSIALETDRVAALAVDAYVKGGPGTLDEVMRTGFSHGFGELAANRDLVAWMRTYNETAAEPLSFHGFDAPTENTAAPSPRRHLEAVAAFLGRDDDVAALLGPDEAWERSEAILDAALSPGATPEAVRVRAIADDMLNELYARTPELVAASSLAEWRSARTHLYAGRGLLRYHAAAARRIGEGERIAGLLATRAVLMAENLLDVREAESGRGPTLVFAHNAHVRRGRSTMGIAGMELGWNATGAVVGALLGERYRVVAGSLGRSAALGLGEPGAGTYEGWLGARVPGTAAGGAGAAAGTADAGTAAEAGAWCVVPTAEVPVARTRTDVRPEHAYAPLDAALVGAADGVLHLEA